jgi:hypothetical protein
MFITPSRSTHRYSRVLCTGGTTASTATGGSATTDGAGGTTSTPKTTSTGGNKGSGQGQNSGTRLAPATINRAIAAVSSFYDYLIVSARLQTKQNPIYSPLHQGFGQNRGRPISPRSWPWGCALSRSGSPEGSDAILCTAGFRAGAGPPS